MTLQKWGLFREKSTNYVPIELYTNLQSSQYFTMAISDQSLTSNETLFLALTKNAYKNVGPHGHPDLNGSCLQLLAIRSKSHPASKFNPPSYNLPRYFPIFANIPSSHHSFQTAIFAL